MSGPEPLDYDALSFDVPPPPEWPQFGDGPPGLDEPARFTETAPFAGPPPLAEPPPPPFDLAPPPPAFSGLPEAEVYDNPDDLARARRRRSAEVLPETSFVDRYRGTTYDTAPPPVVVDAQPRRRRPPTWLVMMGGVALLAVGLAGGFYVAFNAPKPGGLNGFRGMTPEPVGVYIVASPSVDPSALVALSTPMPTASPPPWATDPLHPAGLFIANMTAADVSYHLDLNMTMTAAGQQVVMAEAADVSGADYAVAATISSPEKDQRIYGVYKAGYFYAKLDDWPWVRKQMTIPGVGVLGNLTADSFAALEYVGPETVDGKLLHHLRLPVTGWPGQADVMASLEISMAPPVFNYDFWVDEDGKPRTATVDALVTMRMNRLDVQVAMEIDYVFSRFGKHISVAAPEHYRDG